MESRASIGPPIVPLGLVQAFGKLEAATRCGPPTLFPADPNGPGPRSIPASRVSLSALVAGKRRTWPTAYCGVMSHPGGVRWYRTGLDRWAFAMAIPNLGFIFGVPLLVSGIAHAEIAETAAGPCCCSWRDWGPMASCAPGSA